MDKILSYTLCEEDLEKTAGGLVNLVLKNCVKVTGHEISAAKFTPDGITCDSAPIRVSQRMQPGQTLRVIMPEEKDETKLIPTRGPVRVLYEDEDLIAVDKAGGEVVHPGPGHYTDTVANYVTWYLQEKSRTGAAGADFGVQARGKATANSSSGGQQASGGAGLRVIGRLDKETSGVLLFAKSRAAAARLQRQRKDGTLVRTYLAVCEGLFPDRAEEKDAFSEPVSPGGPDAAPASEDPEDSEAINSETITEDIWYKRGTIDRPLEKEPGVLMRMRIAQEGCGQRAVTHYEVIAEKDAEGAVIWLQESDMIPAESEAGRSLLCPKAGLDSAPCSLLRITIETGRTHQIRVHMASIGHPLVGDTLYGTAARQDPDHVKSMPDRENSGPRALLHAYAVRFRQPFTGKNIYIVSNIDHNFPQIRKEIFMNDSGLLHEENRCKVMNQALP